MISKLVESKSEISVMVQYLWLCVAIKSSQSDKRFVLTERLVAHRELDTWRNTIGHNMAELYTRVNLLLSRKPF